MPVQVFGQDEIEKVLVANPDLRFASTYLSNTYRKYAVNGETLQDKATGEIFTKRPEDGRVVSFFQNKKYMYDLMLELKILTSSNPSFRLPSASNTEALYLSTDYDLMRVYDEAEHNIWTEDDIFTPDSVKSHNIVFKISNHTNGFFCRVTPRDADKALINFLTEEYDNIIKNYSGTDPEYLAEKELFDTIPMWDKSNAVINYTITFTNPNGYSEEYIVEDYVHIAEEHSVIIPYGISDKYIDKGGDVTIRINGITYRKLHFMLNHLNGEQTDQMSKFSYPDNKILIPYLNIISFVDKASDIIDNDNHFVIGLIDVPYCLDYMEKITKIVVDSPMKFILSPDRPDGKKWLEGGIWGEEVRNVYAGGVIVNRHSETLLDELELLLSNLSPTVANPFDCNIVESN